MDRMTAGVGGTLMPRVTPFILSIPFILSGMTFVRHCLR